MQFGDQLSVAWPLFTNRQRRAPRGSSCSSSGVRPSASQSSAYRTPVPDRDVGPGGVAVDDGGAPQLSPEVPERRGRREEALRLACEPERRHDAGRRRAVASICGTANSRAHCWPRSRSRPRRSASSSSSSRSRPSWAKMAKEAATATAARASPRPATGTLLRRTNLRTRPRIERRRASIGSSSR